MGGSAGDRERFRSCNLINSQTNERRSGSKVATASFANNPPIVAGGNQPFTFASRAHLPGFRVDDSLSTGAMVLRLILDRPRAFFVSFSFADGAGDLPGFIVLKFNDELPFGDGVLGHTNPL